MTLIERLCRPVEVILREHTMPWPPEYVDMLCSGFDVTAVRDYNHRVYVLPQNDMALWFDGSAEFTSPPVETVEIELNKLGRYYEIDSRLGPAWMRTMEELERSVLMIKDRLRSMPGNSLFVKEDGFTYSTQTMLHPRWTIKRTIRHWFYALFNDAQPPWTELDGYIVLRCRVIATVALLALPKK
jgi:hypothetical protein